MAPPLTCSQVANCSFSAWYPTFRAVTLKSVVLPLSDEFVEYLNADGVFLPRDRNGNHQPHFPRQENSADDESDSTESDTSSADSGGDDEDDPPAWATIPDFPDLERDIAEAIKELGGAVFPKLNWSSPKDASWVALGGSLKCHSSGDVFLLLKSSDFVAHDLSHAFDNCVDGVATDTAAAASAERGSTQHPRFELVLRKWYDLNPALEFRCFVRNHELVAVCQRDYRNHYDFLFEMRPMLQDKIQAFFDNKIKGRFPDASYVFDVYVNKGNQRVWLLDFNPFGASTDTLVFDWDTLLNAPPFADATSATSGGDAAAATATDGHQDGRRPILRLVTRGEASRSVQPAYAANQYPKDAVELTDARAIDEFAARFARGLLDAAGLAAGGGGGSGGDDEEDG
ncbi:hypothetical protein HK405_007121 [Cladochytrium tenue]|nr:hypothetical protein HK405_007121 [Cladochytrium tenue]